MSDWSDDIDKVLDNIRINCVILSKLHKQRYFELQSTLKYFVKFVTHKQPSKMNSYVCGACVMMKHDFIS